MVHIIRKKHDYLIRIIALNLYNQNEKKIKFEQKFLFHLIYFKKKSILISINSLKKNA